jgi:hypothetical protein
MVTVLRIVLDPFQTAAKRCLAAFHPLDFDIVEGAFVVDEVAVFEFQDPLMGSIKLTTSCPAISRARHRADVCFGAPDFRAPVRLLAPIDPVRGRRRVA